jgi:outer membrane protein assembly factor BamB
MLGYCRELSFRTSVVGPSAKPTVRWDQAVGAVPNLALLVAAGGNVIVVTTTPTVTALDPTTGNAVWPSPFAISSGVTTSPALGADGTIYISAGTSLYAIDSRTGLAKWPSPVANASSSRAGLVIAANGYVLLSDATMRVMAFEPSATTASVKWMYGAPSSIDFSPPAIDRDGNAFVATSDGIEMVDRDGGFVRTVVIPGVTSDQTAVAPDGTLRLQSDALQKLFGRRSTGEVLFDAPTATESYYLAVGSDGTTYVPLTDNSLRAIDATGMQRWSRTDGPWSSPTVGGDGTVYAVKNNAAVHTLFAMAASDGHTLWQVDLPGTASDVAMNPVLGAGGWMFVTSTSEHVYGLGP